SNKGQLGSLGKKSRSLPTEIKLPGRCVDIAAGESHLLLCMEDGTVLACGDNQYNQCDSPMEYALRAVQGIHSATQVACGLHHSGALLANGDVLVWGRNPDGRLQAPPGVQTPTRVPDLPRAMYLNADAHVTSVITCDNEVIAWGAEY
ncbi:hypothetical protein KIPB_012933, partial [Kipferlia bialata]